MTVRELDTKQLEEIAQDIKKAKKEKDPGIKSGLLLIFKQKSKSYLKLDLEEKPRKYLEDAIRKSEDGHSKNTLKYFKQFISFYKK